MFVSEERFIHKEFNYQHREEYFKEYMMGVLKYLYQIENIKFSKKIRELISDRADKVIKFLLSADMVKNLISYFTNISKI